MSGNENTIAKIQREYFRLLSDCLPKRVWDLMRTGSIQEMQNALIAELAQPSLYDASGTKKSSTEVALEEAVRAVNTFWKDNAEPLQLALADTNLYSVTLETQRFPSQLPKFLRRFSIYFDCVGMVDLVHLPHGDSLERVLRDPAGWRSKHLMFVWLAWMVRASEVATIDTGVPVFLPLPNLMHDPEANSAMNDLAAQYLAAHVPGLTGVTSSEELHDYVYHSNGLTTKVRDVAAFHRLCERFDDEKAGVWDGKQMRHIWLKDLSLQKQIDRIHILVGTTFACARETLGTSLPLGWDPVLYHRSGFLHEWMLTNIGRQQFERSTPGDTTYEQTAVSALIGDDLKFLETVSTDELRQVRESRQHRELRNSLSLSRDAFKAALRRSPDAALREFATNFRDAIQRFGNEYTAVVNNQKATRWKAGLSFAGATSLTALTFAFPAAALLSAVAAGVGTLVGGKSVLDVINLEKESKVRRRQLESNPLMLLYKAINAPEG